MSRSSKRTKTTCDSRSMICCRLPKLKRFNAAPRDSFSFSVRFRQPSRDLEADKGQRIAKLFEDVAGGSAVARVVVITVAAGNVRLFRFRAITQRVQRKSR